MTHLTSMYKHSLDSTSSSDTKKMMKNKPKQSMH